jgi:hypothetical protein
VNCYHCNGSKISVIESRLQCGNRHRWYRCHDCGKRVHTIERWAKPGPAPGTPKSGPAAYGERNAASVFLAADIIKVRELAQSGMMQKDIAARFGMRPSYVSRIINRHVWKHI